MNFATVCILTVNESKQIKILKIKNNSSEVSDHLLWLFLASSGEFCNSMYFDSQYISKQIEILKCLKEEEKKQFLLNHASISWI